MRGSVCAGGLQFGSPLPQSSAFSGLVLIRGGFSLRRKDKKLIIVKEKKRVPSAPSPPCFPATEQMIINWSPLSAERRGVPAAKQNISCMRFWKLLTICRLPVLPLVSVMCLFSPTSHPLTFLRRATYSEIPHIITFLCSASVSSIVGRNTMVAFAASSAVTMLALKAEISSSSLSYFPPSPPPSFLPVCALLERRHIHRRRMFRNKGGR